MAKTIPLTQGKCSVVDDLDFKFLNRWKWFAFRAGNTWYAIRNLSNRKQLRMHAAILPPKGRRHPDHKDRDGLNNRRTNLRLATKQQNAANASRHRDNASGYKGVSWHKIGKKWMASIGVDGKQVYLGLFKSKSVAARAYDMAAIRFFGNYAATNGILK